MEGLISRTSGSSLKPGGARRPKQSLQGDLIEYNALSASDCPQSTAEQLQESSSRSSLRSPQTSEPFTHLLRAIVGPDQTTLMTALTAAGVTGTALAAAKALSQPWCLRITDILERAGAAYLAPKQLKRLAVAKADVQIIEANAKAEADSIAHEAQFQIGGSSN